MNIEGKQVIGFQLEAAGTETFRSFNPATGLPHAYTFFNATKQELDKAVSLAAAAFQVYRKKTGKERATYLEAIAEEIKNLGDELIDVCVSETGLPKPRIEGERDRTMNQLKLFASVVREGSWVGARIETALPERTPLPKPDLRYMEIALGPVAVFGASNFPLAFSVAGGDTASALAAGCTVVVKGHPAHPATGELVARAIQKASQKCNMPEGVFSFLHGDATVGVSLVSHPEIKAVGFTGSFRAGKGLFDIAAKRPVPIPVYAEMGSVNPVFILPEALRQRKDQIAQGFATSVTLGVGQFCTNPGLLIYEKSSEATEFAKHLEQSFNKTSGGVMLTRQIQQSYHQSVSRHRGLRGIQEFSAGSVSSEINTAKPILFKTDSETFIKTPALEEEIFGPASVVVEAETRSEIMDIARNLSGHLTATVHGTPEDLKQFRELIDILEQKVGRVVINGFPTGVEVCHAMVHGGPFPATTDSRSTSVGSAAIHRFTRPVCYQNLPDELLSDELKNNNPSGIWRLLNGEYTKNSF